MNDIIQILSPALSALALFMARRFVDSVDKLEGRVQEMSETNARIVALLDVLMAERKK